jgi:hypothetical protein
MPAGQGGVRKAQTGNAFRWPAEDATMSGMTAFLIAVGGVSGGHFLADDAGQNRSAARKSTHDSSGTGTNGSSDGGSHGWSIFGWFSGDSSSSGNSGSSIDFGSGDSGGGDGGGGGRD